MQRLLTARLRIHTQQQTGDATVVWPQYTRNTDVGHFWVIFFGGPCVCNVCMVGTYTFVPKINPFVFKAFDCKSIKMNAMRGVLK